MKSIKLTLSAMLFSLLAFVSTGAWADVYLGGPATTLVCNNNGACAVPGGTGVGFVEQGALMTDGIVRVATPIFEPSQIPPRPIRYIDNRQQFQQGVQYVNGGQQGFGQIGSNTNVIDPRCPQGGVAVAQNPNGGYRCAIQNGGQQGFGQIGSNTNVIDPRCPQGGVAVAQNPNGGYRCAVQNGAYGMVQQGYGQHANVITTALGVSGEVLDGCTNGAGMGMVCGYVGGRLSGKKGWGWKGLLLGGTAGLARSASEH